MEVSEESLKFNKLQAERIFLGMRMRTRSTEGVGQSAPYFLAASLANLGQSVGKKE